MRVAVVVVVVLVRVLVPPGGLMACTGPKQASAKPMAFRYRVDLLPLWVLAIVVVVVVMVVEEEAPEV